MAKPLDRVASHALAPDDTLADRMGMGDAELAALLQFSAADQVQPADVTELHAVLDPHIPEVVDLFYRHLEQFPALRALVADEDTRRRLLNTMGAYLKGVGHAIHDPSYAEERLRIGIVHERIGLGPTWYLGAHAMLAQVIVSHLAAACAAETEKLARLAITLNKVLFFDASLGIHAYHQATVDALEDSLKKAERTEAELRKLSAVDGLTGTLNRMALMNSLNVELQRFLRYGHEFTVLFIDFDHFKSINDTYGHAFGDQVLTESVSLIRRSIRSMDILGRYGGEELVVILVECGKGQSQIIAERTREAISTHTFVKKRTRQEVSATVSIGLHTPSRRAAKAETVLQYADRALYAAKAAGRNRVVTYRAEMGVWSPSGEPLLSR